MKITIATLIATAISNILNLLVFLLTINQFILSNLQTYNDNRNDTKG